MIDGNKMTITWDVNKLEISHVENKGVTKVIEWMKGIYGNHMRDLQGNNHDYLIMELDFLVDGRLG